MKYSLILSLILHLSIFLLLFMNLAQVKAMAQERPVVMAYLHNPLAPPAALPLSDTQEENEQPQRSQPKEQSFIFEKATQSNLAVERQFDLKELAEQKVTSVSDAKKCKVKLTPEQRQFYKEYAKWRYYITRKIEGQFKHLGGQFLGGEDQLKVRFELHPDGSVSNAQVVSSSGNPVLDANALEAVKSIGPVFMSRQFLPSAREMTVNLRFGNGHLRAFWPASKGVGANSAACD